MTFSEEDKHVIKFFRQNKHYEANRFLKEFLHKTWSRSGLNKIIRKIDHTGTSKRLPGSGRSRTARTVDKIVSRPDGSSYGGIVIFHRSHLSVRRILLASSPTTFEALAVSVSSPRGPLTILAAYRPGSTSPSSLFFHEFAVLLEQFALNNAQLVITGDLNLHLEDPSLPASSEFHTIIDQFGLAQHVAEPTHKAGGWLDVVL